MAKKSDDPQPVEGAPSWMVTYGDMMTLLLCFFVIIVAMSETKKDERFRKVMEAIRQQFGYHAAMQSTPGKRPPMNSLRDRLSGARRPESQQNHKHGNRTRSLSGRFVRVRRVREGLKITLGGPVLFKRGRAELSPEARDELENVAGALAGKPHKLAVKGHTDRRPLPPDSPYADRWDLGYARAKMVAEFLIAHGIDAARINIATAGAHETYKQTRQEVQRVLNRRVEIYVTESYVGDYLGKTRADAASGPTRGAARSQAQSAAAPG